MPTPMPSGYDAPLKNLSPVVAQVLYNRGLTHDELPAFLHPEAASMHAPSLMYGMREAVRHIRAAIARGDCIAVYGDFDVDGVTGTVLLHQILSALGANCRVYVPHRASEGYGLNAAALDRLRADGVSLVITVDCGISSADEVEHARAIGLDVIVTDHHTPPPRLPAAVAILNPRQPKCAYPFKDLAGVGVAFKLASALAEGLPNGQRLRRDVLDLVAIGTVSDMVPLRGENRILVRYGLSALTHTQRLGLRALMRRAGLEHAELTTNEVGFRLGPRLNAAGRIDHAMVGCRLLMTTDAAEAEDLADALEQKNGERQRLTAQVIEEARRRIGDHPTERALVVDDPAWPAGVIGLVAGRLAEEYCRPVLVVERIEGAPPDAATPGPPTAPAADSAAIAGPVTTPAAPESRGSGRSVPGFNLIEALASCGDLLTKFGGHAQAAGFSLPTAHIPALRARLAALAAASLREEDLEPTIEIDAEVGGRDFGVEDLGVLFDQLEALEPFGIGNRSPTLLWRNLRVGDCRAVGANHLRFSFNTSSGTVGGIAFGRAGDVGVLPRGSVVDVVCTLQYNEWNGRASIELRIKDVAVRGGAGRSPEHPPSSLPASSLA